MHIKIVRSVLTKFITEYKYIVIPSYAGWDGWDRPIGPDGLDGNTLLGALTSAAGTSGSLVSDVGVSPARFTQLEQEIADLRAELVEYVDLVSPLFNMQDEMRPREEPSDDCVEVGEKAAAIGAVVGCEQPVGVAVPEAIDSDDDRSLSPLSYQTQSVYNTPPIGLVQAVGMGLVAEEPSSLGTGVASSSTYLPTIPAADTGQFSPSPIGWSSSSGPGPDLDRPLRCKNCGHEVPDFDAWSFHINLDEGCIEYEAAY